MVSSRSASSRVPVGADVADEVDGLVGEAVLVAEQVTGRPPRAGVGVRRLGDEDAAEAGGVGVLGAVVELQLVHPLLVERQRAAAAVELDPQRVLPPGREPRRFERRHRAAGEATEEQGGVVDVDGPPLLAARRGEPGGRRGPLDLGRQRPLPDERLGQCRNARQRVPGEVLGHVDDVRPDVAQRARPRRVPAQPPDQRELGVDDPVLQVLRPDVPDLADPALLDEPARERHCRHPPVAVADHAAHPS